ncbi:unnamed protein product [Paramecium primaurelia]|uniref:Uncharacterized protein n=2 Tax=Paramecium TaxID=5884 RepID=A0A8S1WV28_9CILI|nr:unnamed protein product [Paramecium primaurelia]CAD8193643.1 unnamed protein product [Paramecium pentaurelia]
MNIKLIFIFLVLLTQGAFGVVTKVTECQAKCDKQVNGCIYTCAQTQMRQSLVTQERCQKLCAGVNKECKNTKCYLDP